MTKNGKPTIVLEGADCAGKTTLARQIKNAWKLPYIHVLKAPEGMDVLVHQLSAIKNLPAVIDRLHWSEEIYVNLLREQPMNDRDFGVVDGFLLAHKAIIIHCSPPLRVLLENVRKNPNGDNHTVDFQTRVWNEYNKTPRTVLPIVKYDFTVDNLQKILTKIETIVGCYYG